MIKEKENKMIEFAKEIAELNGYELTKKRAVEIKEIPSEWVDTYKDKSAFDLSGALAANNKQITIEENRLKEVKAELEAYLRKEPVTPINSYFMNKNNMLGSVTLNPQNISITSEKLENLQELSKYIAELISKKERTEMFTRIASSVPAVVEVTETTGITGRKLNIFI